MNREELLLQLGVDQCAQCKVRMVEKIMELLRQERQRGWENQGRTAGPEQPAEPKPPARKPRYTVPEEGVRLLEYMESHELNCSAVARELGIAGNTLSGSLRGTQRMSKNTLALIREYLALRVDGKKPGPPGKKELRRQLRVLDRERNLRGQDIAERSGAQLADVMDLLENREPQNPESYRLVRQWMEETH